MKKIIDLLLILSVVFTLGITAMAAPGGFVESPSVYDGPYLVRFSHSNPDFDGNLIITPYLYRDRLSSSNKNKIVDAYKDVSATVDLTELEPELKEVVTVPVYDLAVKELFFAHVEGKSAKSVGSLLFMTALAAEESETEGTFTITLDCDDLSNYQALLNCVDGEWKLVDTSKIDEDGYLTFETETLDSFAIVVSDDNKAPDTGDNNVVFAAMIVFMFASTVCAVMLGLKKKTSKV